MVKENKMICFLRLLIGNNDKYLVCYSPQRALRHWRLLRNLYIKDNSLFLSKSTVYLLPFGESFALQKSLIFSLSAVSRLQQLLVNQLMITKEQEYIEFHQQFDKLVYLKGKEIPLAPTPMKGVERKILERRGDQVARRATSIVTYAPDSSFSAHVHAFGQEFYVLEGTFSDHTGDFSAGWYVRNPVKSSHAPFSKQGTKIFVKLGQFPADESQPLRLNTNILDFSQVSQGVRQLILYESPYEQVFLYKLDKGFVFVNQEKADISQIFVISGSVQISQIGFEPQSWIRIPKGTKYDISAVEESKIYVKIGKGVVRNKDWSELAF